MNVSKLFQIAVVQRHQKQIAVALKSDVMSVRREARIHLRFRRFRHLPALAGRAFYYHDVAVLREHA